MKEKRVMPYILYRDSNLEILFEAAYVKHYYEGYCALFAQYPASDTTVLLCRNVGHRDKSYGEMLCCLYRCFGAEEKNLVGYFTPICEASSEEEATKIMHANIDGSAAIRTLLEGST